MSLPLYPQTFDTIRGNINFLLGFRSLFDLEVDVV